LDGEEILSPPKALLKNLDSTLGHRLTGCDKTQVLYQGIALVMP
jgi:hypothetical protein